MTTDTLTRDEVCTQAAELMLAWALEDDEDLRREFGIDETGCIDGTPINTRAQARGVHSAIAAVSGR